MIDIKNKRCEEPECNKKSIYGLPGTKNAQYCSEHKKDNMIDIKNKRCLEINCDIKPNYGLPGTKNAQYCNKHKKDNMINIMSKSCLEINCDKQPSYGLPGTKNAQYCKDHKKDNMIDIASKRCLEINCNKLPIYGLPGSKTKQYCFEHKKDNMIDIKHKLCETCCSTRQNQNYKPNCARCHFYLNPDDPRIRNYKTKEHAFMLPLVDLYPDIILDKVINGGCSKRRPDGLIDMHTHSIIIEIDEDQHSGYESLCDNRRTMELFTDLGNRPIIFIRLNPDSYKVNNKRHNSVFKLDKNSTELVKNVKEFNYRYQLLIDAIDVSIKNIPNKDISYVKICYTNE